ncbi:unnamed protein product [Porites evermanni]|uniref:Uncharacterized protein n=1 Tax=Porites evermanni TaxID=104178 RepID=A0ABN8M283_9CNID|nr:unnamed protein product [Porites evermanni]
MAAPNPANVNTQNQGQCTTQGATVPTLTALQSDTAVQEELKALEESLGDPIHLGLSDELADPAQKLLEPSTTPRGKRPLLIPDFVSSLPVVLEEDRETVRGASGGAQIIFKTSHEKKPPLNNITFPQWSAEKFRIMHTLAKEGALSTMSDIMNYISYSTKVSELAKTYLIARVVHYDDLYRRMQFATGCKWVFGGSPPVEAHSYSLPPSLNTHSPAELFLNSLVEPLAGDSSTASPIAGKYPYISLETAEVCY